MAATPSRARLHVIEHAFVTEADRAACRTRPPEQVDGLVAVHKRRGQAVGLFEHRAADEHARAGDDLKPTRLIDGWMVCREAFVEMTRQAILADNDPGML